MLAGDTVRPRICRKLPHDVWATCKLNHNTCKLWHESRALRASTVTCCRGQLAAACLKQTHTGLWLQACPGAEQSHL